MEHKMNIRFRTDDKIPDAYDHTHQEWYAEEITAEIEFALAHNILDMFKGGYLLSRASLVNLLYDDLNELDREYRDSEDDRFHYAWSEERDKPEAKAMRYADYRRRVKVEAIRKLIFDLQKRDEHAGTWTLVREQEHALYELIPATDMEATLTQMVNTSRYNSWPCDR